MEKNWESYDKPSFKKTMMAEKKMGPMEAKASIKKANYQEIEVDFETANAKGSWTLPLYAFTFYDLPVNEEGGEVTLSVERDGEEYIYYGDMEGNSDNFEAEEPVVQEPDWIPAGDGRAIGQQDFAINLSPLHAETSDDAEEFCVGCQTLVSAYDVVNAKGGDVCLPCWSKQGGEIIDGVAYTQEEASRYGRPKGYRNAETLMAENSDKTFEISDVWFDTYDEESDDDFEDEYGYTQSYEQPEMDDGDEIITLDGDDDMDWEDRDLDMELADAISDATGFSVYSFTATEILPDGSKKVLDAESEKKTPSQYTFDTYHYLSDQKEELIRYLTQLEEGGADFEVREEPMRRLNEIEGEMNSIEREVKFAESRFDKLSNEIAKEYKEKGMSPEKAQEVGDATAAKIGRAKYGKKGMRKMQRKGMKSDTVGNPSPTFNEDITGQDGPSADPTNQTFEAMRTLAPSSTDVTRARRDLKNSGYGDVIYDRYMVYRDGSSNKFYYTAVTEKDGKYYPMGAYGRIGYLSKLFNIYGKTENPRASLSTMDSAYRQCSGKEKAKIKKGYVDYTLQMAESFESETLAQIEGPTAEATTGGLHSPSSFAMTWEDGTGQSSASIPPNEIAWAENVKAGEGKIFGIGIGTLALSALGILGVKKLMGKKSDTASGDDTKKAEKGCGCSKTVAKSETVKKHSEYSADRINPVEVEGQNDIRNAESISLPQPNMGPQTAHRQNNRPSLNLW